MEALPKIRDQQVLSPTSNAAWLTAPLRGARGTAHVEVAANALRDTAQPRLDSILVCAGTSVGLLLGTTLGHLGPTLSALVGALGGGIAAVMLRLLLR